MKLRSLLLGLIFVFCTLVSQAQVVTKYSQGFESSGETYGYTVESGTAAPQSAYAYGGSRALKLSHTNQSAVVVLDTIDFSDNGSFQFYTLEFAHISDVNPMTGASNNVCGIIEIRRVDQTQWVTLDNNYYDMNRPSYSTDFASNGSVSNQIYGQWNNGTINNSWWKKERFNFGSLLQSVPLSQRKILIRFTQSARTAAGTSTAGWYLDNIQVKASPQSMAQPKLTLLSFPDLQAYPTSRSTRLEVEATTSAMQGMCTDSIYVLYRLGSGSSIQTQKVQMTPIAGRPDQYRTYIPFCGYDTVVYYRIVAKDNTLNHNTMSYPEDEGNWATYHSVRGYSNNQMVYQGLPEQGSYLAQGSLSNVVLYPFPNNGISRSQMIYDKHTLEAAGYRPGAITNMTFYVGANVNNSQHPAITIKMANVDTNFSVSEDLTAYQAEFYTTNLKTCYDSSLTITQNNGTNFTIGLKDTFFYAGQNILVQITYKSSSDPAAVALSSFNIGKNNQQSLYQAQAGYLDFDPYHNALFQKGLLGNKRPNVKFAAYANLPLIYDCGVSGFINPNDSISADANQANAVTVRLTNYGASPINAVTIYYKIDNQATQSYNWVGNLAGGASTNVVVNSNQMISVGYHEMTAWVDDSVTVGSFRYRDHEPLNDTCHTRFVSCTGPMSGNLTVGGTGANYQTLEQFLYAVSQCGVGGPLYVKLQSGTYAPAVIPSIPGTSASCFVQFEPATPTGIVTFAPSNQTGGTTTTLMDVRNANHIRFKNIRFVSNATTCPTTYLARLGLNSTGCQFLDCSFEEIRNNNVAQNFVFASALLYSGGADSTVIDGCTFKRGTIGISMVGPAVDNLAHGNCIRRSYFEKQGNTAVIVRNQVATVVDSNTMNDVLTNSSYVLLVQDCYQGATITRNTVYSTTGSACLGVTDLSGTATKYAIIANNMIISDDAGTSNMLTTPLNIITADYTKIVFNSVKLNAPQRSGIAAATFGGGEINHSYFFNNIVACMDTVDFAFNYIPNAGNINYIGYNIYYTASPLLNKFGGINCMNIAAWQSHYSDAMSQQVNPAFLLSNNLDLRSYSQNVKNHGVTIAEVNNDIYGTLRGATPCVGAFEFLALPYDFEVVGLVEPFDEYCVVPNAAPLRVMIKNNGVNTFIPGTSGNLNLTYSRSATPGVMSPTNSGNVLVTDSIPGGATIIFNTNHTVQIPTNGLRDSSYTFSFWLTSTLDPNPANDTSSYVVNSHYHAPAPNMVNHTATYGNPTTVTITNGVQSWASNIYNSGRQEKSTIYWYNDPSCTVPFYRGNTYTTDILYHDTTFYIRQKRELPLVKISEVQLKNNGEGVTFPQPLWMNTATTFAVELTNVGDYPANMLGDTLMLVSVNANNTSANTALNNKMYIFPNVTIQPHSCLVVQFRAGINNVDSTQTLATATLSPANNANFAILYRDKKGVVDGVAFNNMPPASGSVWTSQNVPASVWAGTGITMPTLSAGVIRKGWPANANATPSNSRNYWQVADSTHIMTIGTVNENLIRFSDNGCEGDTTSVHIHLNLVPQIDLALDSITMPDGCGLGNEDVTVRINNYGSVASGQVIAHYSINGVLTCTDTLANGVAGSSFVNHTFSQPANLYVASGNQHFDIKVWVDQVSGDNSAHNDTTGISLTSYYTPGAPNVPTYRYVQYASRDTLTAIGVISDSLAWYDRNMNPLDTTNVYITNHLFANDTFYVTAFGTKINPVHVGNLASVNTATGYPSPLNPNKIYGREQYLYTAQNLIDAGHTAGPISSIAFYLDTILGAGTMTFNHYKVFIGSTTQASFTGNSNWQTLDEKFSTTSLTLTNANKGWVTFDFDTPFIWDGTSNIVVGVTRSLDAAITAGAQTRYTTGPSNSVLYKADANAATIGTGSITGSRSANRPDIQFGFVDLGCEGPASTICVEVGGIPNVDASLEWPAFYDTMSFSSCGPVNFDVTVRNGGVAPLSSYTIDYWVDGTHGVYNSTTGIGANDTSTIAIATPSFTPGRHTLLAVVSAISDTVHVNDTISRMINVSFCAGTYTIGPAATNNYPSFAVALDTLYGAGVAGPVIFNVQSGTYNEQLAIGEINGTSLTNTITFRSAVGDSSAVILTYAPTNADNYVLKLDGANHIQFKQMTIYAAGTGNYSNAVWLTNCENIHFTKSVIRVKGTINNTNANAILIYPGVRNLYIDSSVVDSGYCSVKSVVPAFGDESGFYFSDSRFVNFLSQGIYLRKLNDVYIQRNTVRSGVSINSRALTGITVAEHNGPLTIERNHVVLFDSKTGGKRCIVVSSVTASNAMRSKIYNNECVAHSTGVAGVSATAPAGGIFIDSSAFVNVYFNSVRVFAGTTANTTRSFSVDHTSSNIYVMDNILSNQSRGYCYWLFSMANVANSNYNSFFSDSTIATKKLARIGSQEITTLEDLRTTTHMDMNSLFDMPYFHANDTLRLEFGTVVEMAQYNTEVPTDIDGYIRPQIPAPTIGCYEYERCLHNVGIMQILEPTLDSNTVEADTLRVVVKLLNDGKSTETNLNWWGEILGTGLRTETRPIDEIQPGLKIWDTAYIALPMGLIDTQYIRIHFDMNNDCLPSNNTADTVFFLEMAYNIKAQSHEVTVGDGCRLHSTPVSITLTNVGRKAIPVNYPIQIGYQAILGPSNPGVTLAQLPLTHTETATLAAPLDLNASVTLNFQQNANLYPTNTDKDVTIRFRAWSTYQYDQKPLGVGNDTTAYTTVTSKYTPNMPIGTDLHIPYATWDTIKATHTDMPPTGAAVHRPIRWYRDSTDAEPFFANSNYARSCWWETPQYFYDSTYYLSCISTTGCTSYYNPVHVFLNSRVATDAAILEVVEPYDKVFMTESYGARDTVKVRIINYGTQPISNIPVVYQYRRQGNNQPILQEVTEICTHTIQPNETYVYKFDSLLHIPVENVNYTIRTWTNLSNEMVRLNDTLRNLHVFKPLVESSYCTSQPSKYTGLDITRVSFNEIDNVVPEVGHSYVNFGAYNNPIYPVLKLKKGTTDTMTVECANSDDHSDVSSQGYLTVLIDYNRDGAFQGDPTLPMYEVIYSDTMKVNRPEQFLFTLPDSICLGYMRMRVILDQSGFEPADGCSSFDYGCVHDYLLYVEDVPLANDAALTRIASPRNIFITGEDSTTVTVMMANKGTQPITSATINYRLIHGSVQNHSVTWTGNLMPGESVPVSLNPHYLDEGTSTFVIFLNNDDENLSNDTIRYQYHRFRVMTLVLDDDFEGNNIFYAPAGFNSYSHNVWELGNPQKPNISACVSDSNVWATNVGSYLIPGAHGYLSYLYTPIIDISQIRPDTISFWMAQAMGDSTFLTLEYYNYEGRWLTVGSGNDSLWYNSGKGWVGSTPGYSYVNYKFSTNRISGEFQQKLQFRFCFHANEGAANCDGVAIDNFRIGRARRNIDVGVIAITHPTHPKFGQTITPKVAIKNYGLDTIYSVNLAYRPYGTNLAKTGTWNGVLPPDQTTLYTFTDPFIVMNDFPDTFEICAYTTVNMDIYWENDSLCKNFVLSPLDNDMAMVSFIYPRDRIVAGDSIEVTTRLRNYGQDPVSSTNVSYLYNNFFLVNETINFEEILGRPLESFEFFNYTFRTKCRASMGTMHLDSWVEMPNDDYLYNDTISKTIMGIAAITDLCASSILVDTTSHEYTRIQLTIDNIGARAANDFEVGFWYDNDTTTIVRDTFRSAMPLASLHTAYFMFDTLLPYRAWPNSYNHVTAYVHIVDDNDPTNDTTTQFVTQFVDIVARRLIVEENRDSTCRVRIEIENQGVLTYDRGITSILATINGRSIRTNGIQRAISPGEVFTLEFNKVIPKDPSRSYVGYGSVDIIGDADVSNNSTSIVDVQNYFEGIPFVQQTSGMTLEQNYPNPYNSETRIDFFIPESGQVRFFVMDEMGRLMYQKSDNFEEGVNSILFNGKDLVTGTYYYGIEMNGERLMRKMVFKK